MTTSHPRVTVIGTGGTIAGVGPDRLDYMVYTELNKHLTIRELLARIPEISGIADVHGEDLLSMDAGRIGPTEWLMMARRVNTVLAEDPDVSGIVVTHGTATLEESAYFLHLTVKSSKPVVVTGAMRPPTALGTDADVNLMDAIRIAASPSAVGKGVLTVLNNEIHCARDVAKINTLRVDTFRPGELGFLGYADSDGEVVFYRTSLRKHTTATAFDIAELNALPRVDIVHTYAGDDALLVNAVRSHGAEGLVMVGFGGGAYPPVVLNAGAQAVKEGLPVVLATRSTAGRVIRTPQQKRLGFIVCDNLLPQKARVLLMLALTVTRDREEIQQMFYEY